MSIHGNTALTNLDGLSALASVSSLWITGNAALTNLDGLSGITSVGGELAILVNTALTNLDGLSGITSVGECLEIYYNFALSDCEACELLDQLTSGPTSIDVYDNLNDTCTPVPGNCP